MVTSLIKPEYEAAPNTMSPSLSNLGYLEKKIGKFI